MENRTDMKALFMVVNAGFAEEVMEIARETGIKGATIMNARGEGASHESFMGIVVDTEKEMILCIADDETAKLAMAAVKEKAGIQTPAHGICFTMPVDQVLGIDMSPGI